MMDSLIHKIEERPVRFAFLIEAILAAGLAFGLQLSVEQFGAIMVVLNAALAFFVDGFTTAVDHNTGEPLNEDYVKVA